MAQKEAERQKRELEKKRKQEEKQQKKIQQYYNRLALDFKKINVILIDSVAIEIIQGALDANLTQAKMISYFVKGEEQKLKKKVTGIILQTKLDEYLEFIDDNEIKNTITYKKVFSHLIKQEYDSVEELEKDKMYEEFSNSLAQRQSIVEMVRDENKLHIFLPEGLEDIIDLIDSDEEFKLTVDSIKKENVYLKAVENKKKLVNEIEKKINALIS